MGEIAIKPIHNVHKKYRQMNIVNPYIFTPPASYLLDTYTGAQIAYSFRKLRSAYGGNCIEVRRSSDNTTSNIGFVNNVLDEVSLLSFVGAGDGFVKTWYDQSGNANNMIQTTDASQPQIVSSGVVITKGGKPAIFSPKTSQLVSNNINQNYDSAFTVAQNETSGNDASMVYPLATNNGGAYYCVGSSGSGSSSFGGWGTPLIYKNGSSTALTNTRGVMFTNFTTGNIYLMSEFSAVTQNQSRLMQYFTTGFRGVFYIKEHITYDSNQTGNKTGIETNINAYYGIY